MKKPLEEVLASTKPGPVVCGKPDVAFQCILPKKQLGGSITIHCPSGHWFLTTWVEDDKQASRREAALLAHFRNVGPELVEALEESRRWLNGDKWRNSEHGQERACWESFTGRLDSLLSRAKEVEVP